ncbi:exopolyphosphatase/guanosine-5'-triphosphate,3'-diphosphate pyrophosphatase [Halospina denitrificans]|uniref:Exopolyphosphatase n=1 Tax=Halospina denitrificans TaxID=332522 RepID=A0A4R7K3V9_9GAMM|nr:exopolyphosphatase [Halospina denitrificans]TDT44309.1 exopolyphosphatase/guanosine-5'-triphosphate,3'-diphosphate pyrophosphatase [Halospina denitrificans]
MTDPQQTPDPKQLLAAIDLGSNSFHMVVAQRVQGEIRTIEKMGEKVQLGAGLDRDNYLSLEAQERGLECLKRFAQRVASMQAESVRVVGTNALRAARNASTFIHAAEEILGTEVEVVAGREEARLIYLGVSHTLSDDLGPRLVIDIGGGSTEFIIGERFETRETESLHMGCVSFRNHYFPDGKISRKKMDNAITHARQELLNIQQRFRARGWENCVGSSGSIKAIESVVRDLNLEREGISRQSMKDLRKRLIDMGRVEKLEALGVREDRRSIFPAGFAILYAAFESLEIEFMSFADGALREGLLYDMAGRDTHEDVRERTIQALQVRYSVDTAHAEAVEQTADRARVQVASAWGLSSPYYSNLLRWACRIHEIGLAISHTQYHKHGAYLMTYSDLPGFSQDVQRSLATLVRAHRRKFNNKIFESHSPEDIPPIKRLALILRLGVLLQHARTNESPPPFTLEAKGSRLSIHLPGDWLDNHPLTLADLQSEQAYVKQADMELVITKGD